MAARWTGTGRWGKSKRMAWTRRDARAVAAPPLWSSRHCRATISSTTYRQPRRGALTARVQVGRQTAGRKVRGCAVPLRMARDRTERCSWFYSSVSKYRAALELRVGTSRQLMKGQRHRDVDRGLARRVPLVTEPVTGDSQRLLQKRRLQSSFAMLLLCLSRHLCHSCRHCGAGCVYRN